ncbi:hypothetical protein LSH36_168g04112 [Paralvinella palmiformis]|uniref:Uncharacterized protein n=1 Tax=Paralvinella palmiformis TaxID=53620 RepID=A0AAD9JSH9_9ANNE|nr:hypothetical protein LSH36_168g04112 [Paralvinella palmiformis]
MSFFLSGDQTDCTYSRCGLTVALNSHLKLWVSRIVPDHASALTVSSRRLDRPLIPDFWSRVPTDFPRYSFSTNRRLFTNLTSYYYWSTLRRHQRRAFSRDLRWCRRTSGRRRYRYRCPSRLQLYVLSILAHLKSSQEIQGHHIAAINGHGLPIHPAFQFQAHPFYPNSLLSAIRQPANGIPKQQPARNMAPLGSGLMSFNIDVIVAASNLRILADSPLKSAEIRISALAKFSLSKLRTHVVSNLLYSSTQNCTETIHSSKIYTQETPPLLLLSY